VRPGALRTAIPLDHATATVLKLGSAQTLASASSSAFPQCSPARWPAMSGLARPPCSRPFRWRWWFGGIGAAGSGVGGWAARPVLALSNLVFALGLGLIGAAQRRALFIGWAVVSVGMAGGLYEAAFATLVRIYRGDARRMITGITLIAGFASTVGWPVSALLEGWLGWRGACWVWSGLHLVVGLPLNR